MRGSPELSARQKRAERGSAPSTVGTRTHGMTTNGSGPHQHGGSRQDESEAETTQQRLKAGSVYVTAAAMPHDSPPGSVESRLEDAIKQLSIIAQQSDDEWFTALMAQRVAELERDWALKNGFKYHGDAI